MISAIEHHKFNDDLLLAPEDRDLAARKYPSIVHVLDHPKLREVFAHYDRPANRAKRRAQKAGFWAVGLIWAALAIAAAEHLAPDAWGRARSLFTAVSGICGLFGVIICSTSILFGNKKREWLERRLMTERIRQFHFQTFVCRTRDVLHSLGNDDAKESFISERALWFQEFLAKFEGKLDSQLADILSDERQQNIWLHRATNEEPDPDSPALNYLFAAYRELRIVHQIGYANYNLQDDGRIFSKVPLRQSVVLSSFGFICFIVIGVLHIGVLAWPDKASIISLTIIWIALAALAARAISDGLQPEREAERYQQYRSAVQFVLERFDRAQSQAEKLQVMREMERLSFDEMRNFLVSGNRSRFVM